MLEHAVDLTAMERYLQEDYLAASVKEVERAEDKARYSEMLKQEAHKDVIGAEDQAGLLETWESSDRDKERLRDLSVAHAARELELDAQEMEFDAAFESAVAHMHELEAVKVLKMLLKQENSLKESLKRVRGLQNEEMVDNLFDEELPKHEQLVSFVKKIKRNEEKSTKPKAPIIDHDPTKGSVAF